MARRGNCLPSALIVALAKAKQRSSDEQVDPEDEGEHDHDEPDEYRIDACGHGSKFASHPKAVSGRVLSGTLLGFDDTSSDTIDSTDVCPSRLSLFGR